MHLVDDEDDVADTADLLDEPLHAALELAAELRARHERREVEQVDLLVAQLIGHVALGDALGKPLGDGRLADAGLADETGIVLLAAVEDLDDALQLLRPADHGVKLAVTGALREIDAVVREKLQLARRTAALIGSGGILPRLLRRLRVGRRGRVLVKEAVQKRERRGLAVVLVRVGVGGVGVRVRVAAEHAHAAEHLRHVAIGDGTEEVSVLAGLAGSAEADRKVPLFVPEYLVSSADDADLQTIITGLGIDPLAYFRVEFSRQDGPGHRDLLGALLGLGIDRNRTGDILLHDSGAELIVTQNVAETVARDFRQAGHFPLNVQSLGSAEELRVSVPELRILRVTVASLRLDNVLAAVWHLNREKAKELITEGLVTLDGLAELRPAKTVREGQLLRCRGFGKARVLHVGGQSRKGREWVEVGLYV